MPDRRLAPSAVLAFGLLAAPVQAGSPANDACDAAEPIAGFGVFPFSTVGASTDGAPTAACTFFGSGQIHNDVWFRWTSGASGLVTVTTCAAAAFDTKLAVFAAGAGCGEPDAVLACNDDACSLQSRVTFAAAAKTTYLIRLGAYAATGSGAGSLVVENGALVDLVNPANGKRYVGYATTTWAAAEATAQALGGHLVSIGDEAENEFVRVEFGNALGVDRRVWIGFTDEGSEGFWRWTDGAKAVYTNWNPGEPNNSGGTEHYAELLGSNGRWNDLSLAGSGFPHLGCAELGEGGGGGGCPADFDLNGEVAAADLSTLLAEWGIPGSFGDLDGDGTVAASDLAILLGSWGPCP